MTLKWSLPLFKMFVHLASKYTAQGGVQWPILCRDAGRLGASGKGGRRGQGPAEMFQVNSLHVST